MAYVESKQPCPRCVRNGRDKAGDNFHFYGEGLGGYCFSCGYTVLSDAEKEARGIDKFEWDDEQEKIVSTKEIITPEESEQIKSYTGTKGHDSRGITDETYKAYAVRFEYSEETGEPTKHYYPYTENYKAAGYKIRMLPKTFTTVGKIGKQSELFGQWRFKNSNSKNVVICSGEVDCLSAFQMLENYRKSRNGDFEPTPVVSSGIGETGSYKQIQLQYEWLNRFEKIIICYDMDEAGKEAVKNLVKVLPKGKMFVMELPAKDTNEMLTKGKEKAWIDAYYKAKPYSPDGIVGSSGLLDKIKEAALVPKVPLPAFMHEVEKQMAGGIPLGVIVNLASSSGSGKSTIVDECTYFWAFNSPHKLGVVTLESDCAQYGTKILSRHISQKIDLIENNEDKLKLLNSSYIEEKSNELFLNPDGSDRWMLIEERDGGLESMKALIMELIISCECKLIILDPVSDLLESLDNETQAGFCKWMKGIVKSHGITFINVAHVRKSASNQKANSTGAVMHEEDIFGSGSLIKSAACNLLFTRNKEAEDAVERNTISMLMSKCRWTGRTGIAGQYYYDNESHTLFDKADWLRTQGSNF